MGVGAGPERVVFIIDREDRSRRPRCDVESTGDREKLGGPITIG